MTAFGRYKNFPGFNIPAGSSASLMARWTSRETSLVASGHHRFFASPIPCSPVITPPHASTCAKRSSRARRSEEHTSELQSRSDLVCRLLLEKKKKCKSVGATKHGIDCTGRQDV